jgi:hypothetical protein
MSRSGSARIAFRNAALVLCLTSAVWAQDSNLENPAQDSAVGAASYPVYSADTSTSLADVARQTRTQHASEKAQKAQVAAAARDWDEPTTFQICDDAICPSMHLTEDVVEPPLPLEQSTPKVVSAALQDGSVIVGGLDGPSLAELARQKRQAQQGQAQSKLDSAVGVTPAPAGFQSFVIQYCLNPQLCAEASVMIPENAEVVSRVNGQHVFKTVLNGEAAMLYAGPADVNAPYRAMTDPDFIRMRSLANPNGASREKAEGISTQEVDLEGKHGVVTRFRYQREEETWWIGERATINMDQAEFLLACTAPEENFTAVETQCNVLISSLRLP